MLLARVTSRVVSSARWPSLPARPMLSVSPVKGYGNPDEEIVALDSVQAGPGDLVLILQEGSGARQAVMDNDEPLPAQMVVIAVVDEVNEPA